MLNITICGVVIPLSFALYVGECAAKAGIGLDND